MSFEIPREILTAEMYAKMKAHILRKRAKKKQEQEANAAAVEKLRREQELKREQSKLTLGEVEDQLSGAHKHLRMLKEEKHELFQQLREVLNVEKKKKIEKAKEAMEKEAAARMHRQHYSNQIVQPVTPSMYTMDNSHGNRALLPTPLMYNVPAPLQTATRKRQRSPSPQPNYQQGYNYKPHIPAYAHGYPIPMHHPMGQYPPQDPGKPLPNNYHVPVPHLPPGGFVQPPPALKGEGFYIPQTSSMASGYPIRSQPQVLPHFQGSTSHGIGPPIQTGGITSGYPIRSQPQAVPHFQVSTPHGIGPPMQLGKHNG